MAEWYDEGGALNIKGGEELLKFEHGTINIHGQEYTVLTGYEILENTCWWCGKPIIQGKRKAHYCRGHSHHDFVSCFRQYHRHFDWSYASSWALERAGRKCENCGCAEKTIDWGYRSYRSNLEVHHIIPLNGDRCYFSAFNLPWNLIVLCRDCHMELHNIMRPPAKKSNSTMDSWEYAERMGQGILPLGIK